MSKKRISLADLLCYFILLFSVSSFIQELFPFSTNRIVIVGIIACLCLLALQHFERKDLVFYGGLAVTLVFTSINTSNLVHNFSEYLYYWVSVVWLVLMAKKNFRDNLKNAFCTNHIAVKVTIAILMLITIVTLFTPSCFREVWDGVNSYIGFVSSPHTAAANICLAMALILFAALEKPFSILTAILLLAFQYLCFYTGARVFAVNSTLIVMLYINATEANTKKRFIKFVLFTGIILFSFCNSSMMSKMQTMLVHAGVLDGSTGGSLSVSGFTDGNLSINGFTNGRLALWAYCLDAFRQSNLINQLLGNDFSYVYEVTMNKLNFAIWAHNDYINLLLCAGILGFSLYIVSLYRCIWDVTVRIFQIFRPEFIYSVIVLGYALFSSVMNGLYTYQHLFMSFLLIILCHNRYSLPKE